MNNANWLQQGIYTYFFLIKRGYKLGRAYVGSVWGNWREKRREKSSKIIKCLLFMYVCVNIYYILIDNKALIIALVLDFVQGYKYEKQSQKIETVLSFRKEDTFVLEYYDKDNTSLQGTHCPYMSTTVLKMKGLPSLGSQLCCEHSTYLVSLHGCNRDLGQEELM